jgi:hypothetical protein
VNGPKSGQSTTVVCTYELVESNASATGRDDPWQQLRGALKNIFSEQGGGEAYLRNERDNFYSSRDHK